MAGTALIRRPSAPDSLAEHGRAEWQRAVDVLVSAGVLTTADLTVLQVLCESLDHYYAADADVKAHGVTVDGAHGGRAQNPALLERHRAWQRYKSMVDAFGLSPSARTRVQAAPQSRQAIPIRNREGDDRKARFFKAGG